jgi:hypothetical protein
MQLQKRREREKKKNVTRFLTVVSILGGVNAFFVFLIHVLVGFLISKILWVVEDIKIKISCLVGKLKPTQLNCVVLPQF